MKTYIFEINKQEVSISESDLYIRDTNISKSASDIAFWGEVQAAMKEYLNLIQGEYRNWMAKSIVKILETEPKLAEWKAKARVESVPGFIKYKKAIAEAQKQYDCSSAIYEAMLTKASSKQSLLKTKSSSAPYVGGIDSTDPNQAIDKQEKIEAYKQARRRRKRQCQ